MRAVVDIGEMEVFARSVWLATRGAHGSETIALAWMLKNRVALRNQSDESESGCVFPSGRRALADVCRKFITDEYVAKPAPGVIDKDEFQINHAKFLRVFSTVCLVWNGDVSDPTNGSIRCHRHDEMPEWALSVAPEALIGSRFFYAQNGLREEMVT